jgi:hypothetical protein
MCRRCVNGTQWFASGLDGCCTCQILLTIHWMTASVDGTTCYCERLPISRDTCKRIMQARRTILLHGRKQRRFVNKISRLTYHVRGIRRWMNRACGLHAFDCSSRHFIVVDMRRIVKLSATAKLNATYSSHKRTCWN